MFYGLNTFADYSPNNAPQAIMPAEKHLVNFSVWLKKHLAKISPLAPALDLAFGTRFPNTRTGLTLLFPARVRELIFLPFLAPPHDDCV